MARRSTRRKRERQQRRREVLGVALNLFLRKGFQKTTMAEIAKQAEFAVGTLYKLFKDKNALYRALILDAVQRFEQTLTAALKGPGSELEKLDRYIEAKATLFVQNIATARLFAQTSGVAFAPRLALERGARAICEKVHRRLETIFRNGIRKKLILDVEPRMLVLGLEGLSNALLLALIERPDAVSGEQVAAVTKRIFFERVASSPRRTGLARGAATGV